MKNIAKGLIVAAAIVAVLTIISRFTLTPIMGVGARPLMGFSGLLLLFAIALKD